jgi:HEPN domain-containing protein
MTKKRPFYLDWLSWAEDDIKYAKKALRDQDCICPALFSTQQCAEKALKAFYCYFNTSEGYWFVSVCHAELVSASILPM